jgi:hypothetical protein
MLHFVTSDENSQQKAVFGEHMPLALHGPNLLVESL